MSKNEQPEIETAVSIINKRSQYSLLAVNAKSTVRADDLRIKFSQNQQTKQSLEQNFQNSCENLV